jgi:hypothetical protein
VTTAAVEGAATTAAAERAAVAVVERTTSKDGIRRGGGQGGVSADRRYGGGRGDCSYGSSRAGRGFSGGRRGRRYNGGRRRGAHSGGGEDRSIVDHRAPERRICLRSQAGGLAKRPYVTRAATPEAVTAAAFSVDRETLTQDALGVQDIHEMRKYNTRTELDQELDHSIAS